MLRRGRLIPYDRLFADPGLRVKPFYLSFEQAAWLWPRPSFTPTRTVNVTSAAQLTAAISGLQAGDLVKNTQPGGFDVTSATTNACVITNNMASETVFDFGVGADAVRFSFTGTSQFMGLWLNGCSNITVYGGDYTSSGSAGLHITGPASNIRVWDFVSHDCAMDAVNVFPINASLVTNVSLRGELARWGQNTANDPHTEKGTGLHGVQFSDSSGQVTNCTLVVWGHDGPTGALVQCGSNAFASTGHTFFLKGERLTKVALSEAAGNVLQLWGSTATSGTAELITGTDCQARVVDAQGITTGGSITGFAVKHGRALRTNLNGSYNSSYDITNPWGVQPGDITNTPSYQDARKVG